MYTVGVPSSVRGSLGGVRGVPSRGGRPWLGGKRPSPMECPWGFVVVKGHPPRGGCPWLGGKRPRGSWWFGVKGPPSRGGCPRVGGFVVVKGPPSRGGCPWVGGFVVVKGPPFRGGCPWVGGFVVVKGPPSRGGCPLLGGRVPSLCCLFEGRAPFPLGPMNVPKLTRFAAPRHAPPAHLPPPGCCVWAWKMEASYAI